MAKSGSSWYRYAVYVVPGFFFGLILLWSEVVSWYRIQEMFRFQSFRMYGIIGSAIVVAAVSLWVLRRLGVKTVKGELIVYEPNPIKWRGNVVGGMIFGFGWALGGACPGPVLGLVGYGQWSYVLVFLGVIVGVLGYGWWKGRLWD